MNRMQFRVILVVLVMLALCGAANAQSQRTFVASTGLDSNPCSRSQPCRNFAAAIGAVAAGGEIVVLDSAGYGPVVINKAVSIVAPAGLYAGITSFAGDAITINDATAGDSIAIRGLTINGLGGSNGIDAGAIAKLYVDGCVISGFSGNGIVYAPAANAALYVRDSVLRDDNVGLSVTASGIFAYVSVERCRIDENGSDGVQQIGNGSAVTLHDTVLTSNLVAIDASRTMFVKNCQIAHNSYGIVSETGSTVYLSSTLVHSNVTGLFVNGGPIYSYGNNEVNANATDLTGGTLTAVAVQ